MSSPLSKKSRLELYEDLAPRLKRVLEAGETFRERKNIPTVHVGYLTTGVLLECIQEPTKDYPKIVKYLLMFENQMIRDHEVFGLEAVQMLLPQGFAAETYEIVNTLLRNPLNIVS